jgi:hypothetical protein
MVRASISDMFIRCCLKELFKFVRQFLWQLGCGTCIFCRHCKNCHVKSLVRLCCYPCQRFLNLCIWIDSDFSLVQAMEGKSNLCFVLVWLHFWVSWLLGCYFGCFCLMLLSNWSIIFLGNSLVGCVYYGVRSMLLLLMW